MARVVADREQERRKVELRELFGARQVAGGGAAQKAHELLGRVRAHAVEHLLLHGLVEARDRPRAERRAHRVQVAVDALGLDQRRAAAIQIGLRLARLPRGGRHHQ